MISRRKILKGGAAAATILWVPLIGARRAFAQTAAPFDYFISPTGDDNNPGTLASPWSITAFNSKMSTYSGKRVGIIGDVAGVQTPIQYGTVGGVKTTLYSKLNSQANQPILNINGGTGASSTYVGSCTSSGVYQRGWAIIDASNPSGGAHATLDAAILMGQNGNTSSQVPNPDNITYDGLTIRNFSYCAIAEESAGANFVNVVIKNCEFYGSTTSVSSNNPGAIRFQATTGAQVLNCKFHDCQNASGSDFGPYAYPGVFSYSSNALIVTNCTFYNIVSVQQKDGSQDAVISYCYLDAGTFGVYGGSSYGTSYYEGTNASGHTTTMHHNICLGMIWNQNATGAAYDGNWEFYNNTCYINTSNPIFYLNPAAGSTFHTYNNILYTQGSWGAQYGSVKFVGANSALAPQWDYNYYHAAPTFYTGSLISYSSWQALGFDAHSHTGGSPFSGIPAAQVPTSFSVNTSSPAYTGGIGGAICGALDGSGTVGCNFGSTAPVLVPAAPSLQVT
jgi:hypothetical protein